MPNIMLTYRCNLSCPYCFANEFVNKQSTDITFENFQSAVRFITKDGPAFLGLIGGEPTLHKDFKRILTAIIEDRKIKECTIYTNGLELDSYFDEVASPKFRLLVNCNSPETIGETRFARIVNNLDILINQRYMRDRINLGINYYSDDLDCSFIIELLKRFDLHRVRLSLTVPDFSVCGTVSSVAFFRQRKQSLMKLLKQFSDNAIVPYYDCNKPPVCIWTDDEKQWIQEYLDRYGVKESNLLETNSLCYPVIDILPTLEAVRCFGMSSFEKVHIHDFDTVTDLASYFLNRVDCEAYHIADCTDCRACYYRKTRHCTAGCIGFKSEYIKKVNESVDTVLVGDC